MNVITTILKELLGLFVDDGRYATGILLWVLAAAFIMPHLPTLGLWRAPLVFAGLLLLLAENVVRSARK